VKFGVVRAVAVRELRDVLRDRRTLFATFVLPVVLYPALTLGFGALAAREKAALGRREARVCVRFDGGPAAADAEHPLLVALAARPQFVLVDETDGPAAVRAGRLALFVDVPADMDARLRERRPTELRPVYRSHDPASAAALDGFHDAVRAVRDRYAPLTVAPADLSAAAERGGARFGGIVAFVVVLMALIGAFGPAVDLAAGEKERGTLEALLTTPASRREIVLGKYLAVLACGVASAVANLASLAASLGSLPLGGAATTVRLDAGSFALVLGALVLLSAVFGAAALTLSAAARTYKEGAAYLSPLYVVVMPLAMTAMLPTAHFADWWWAPVANVGLLVKAAMTGEAEALPAFGAAAVLAVLAAAALETAARAFEREEILFRDSGEAVAARRTGAAGAPTFGLALFAPVLAVGLARFAAPPLAPYGIAAAALAQFACFAGAAYVAARAAGCATREAFGLRAPPPRAWLGGLLLGLAAPALALEAGRLVGGGAGPEAAERLFEELRPLLERGPAFALLFAALLPALVEELHFRGFVQPGLVAGLGRIGGPVAAAAVFAAAHLSPERFAPLFLLGLLFGVARSRSGSTWPGALAHFANNGAAVAAATLPAGGRTADALGFLLGGATGPARVAVAAAALATAALGLRLCGRDGARLGGPRREG
jgi:sodium transport system permease protein